MADMAPLVMILGVGTFFVGIVLHTFFGINLYEASWVPQWLKKCMISGTVAGYDAQMVLAIGVGIFHICLAMIVKSIGFTKRFGFAKAISTWGWTLLIVGSIVTGGLALMGVIDTPVVKIILIAIGIVSGLGIFLLNDLHRNPLINIGSGLWDTYNTATGLMGDVLSYLRLYALGLAGGMLGNTFNFLAGMGLDMPVPGLNYLLFAFIVLIGHVLNLALSCLGAFVHPLRLTFVEYFKNSGYEGSGREYRPLK
jgi:Archaeal/vacuolar-type H+-ATPase subunit I